MYCNAIYQLWSQIALVLQASIKCVLETISYPEVVTQCKQSVSLDRGGYDSFTFKVARLSQQLTASDFGANA